MINDQTTENMKKSQIDEIKFMIATEDDPKTRGTLLLVQNLILELNSVVGLINSVTHLVNDVEARFNRHREDFETKSRRDDRIIIQGKTMYKGVMGVLFFAQSLVIGIIIYGYNSFEEVRDQGNRLNYQVQRIEAVLEKKQTLVKL